MEKKTDLDRALEGDINAFHGLFAEFKDQLKSYLYRLVADRNDAEDLAQDAFVKAFDKISTFQQKSSLKTWVFSIATRLAYDFLRNRPRWSGDVMDKVKERCCENGNKSEFLYNASLNSVHGEFDISEHINFCFTCISKTIPLEQQVTLMLKDVYEFQVKEVALIIGKTVPAVKHILRFARQTMIDVFDNRCALVNKNGACHQCSELNGWFNPKQNQQEALMKLNLTQAPANASKEQLLALRQTLVKAVDPLQAKGTDLHEAFMKLHRLVEGEINEAWPDPPVEVLQDR